MLNYIIGGLGYTHKQVDKSIEISMGESVD